MKRRETFENQIKWPTDLNASYAPLIPHNNTKYILLHILYMLYIMLTWKIGILLENDIYQFGKIYTLVGKKIPAALFLLKGLASSLTSNGGVVVVVMIHRRLNSRKEPFHCWVESGITFFWNHVAIGILGIWIPVLDKYNMGIFSEEAQPLSIFPTYWQDSMVYK